MQWEKLYYVGCDAEQSGIMQGEIAAEYINSHPEVDKNKDGKIQYVLLEGEAGHQDAISRTEYSVKTLMKKAKLSVSGLEPGTGGKPHEPSDQPVRKRDRTCHVQ